MLASSPQHSPKIIGNVISLIILVITVITLNYVSSVEAFVFPICAPKRKNMAVNNNNVGRIRLMTNSPSILASSFMHRSKRDKWTQTELKLGNLGDLFNFNKKKGVREDDPVVESKEEDGDNDNNNNNASDEFDDPLEKLFGIFFGEKEEEPMGMKRFGKDRFPEQYPAVVDEWASPVSSDDEEMATIRPFLKCTNLEQRDLIRTYDAEVDGWDATSFHRAVDRKGGGIVLCVTEGGLVCGGYNPKGWVGYGEARGSLAAFLFRIGGPYLVSPEAPGTKLKKVGGASFAQVDEPEKGPSFGADSLVISLGGSEPRRARSKLGSYYERYANGVNSLFGKDIGNAVILRSLKVYQGAYDDGEFIPHTEAEPFALD